MKKNNIIILLFCFFTMLFPIQATAMVQTQTTGSASASMDSENKPDITPKGFTPKGNATVVDDCNGVERMAKKRVWKKY